MKGFLYLLPLALLLMAPGPNVGGFGFGGNPRPNDPALSYAFFEFAPSSGAGLPSAANLCDTLQASEKVGNWWCLNGDGTMASGSAVTATPGSGVSFGTQTVCPSGPACASQSVARFDDTANGVITLSSMQVPQGDFSLCHLGTSSIGASSSEIASMGGVSGFLWREVSGQTQFYVGTAPIILSNHTAGAHNFNCATYEAATDTARLYANGALSGSQVVSTPGASSWTTAIQARGGYQSGFFLVPERLSDARIAAIARAVLADAPTGARGEALSETRASVQFCESSDGTGSLLPNNRLCVTRGGTTAAQRAFTQSLLQTEAIDNAAWTKNGIGGPAAPVVTQNYAVSPGGTLTAERVQISACPGGSARSDVTQAGVVAASTTYIGSVWLAATSGTQTVSLCTDGASGVCTQKTLTTTPQRYVTAPFTSSGSGAAYLAVGCMNTAPYSGATDTGAADILMWGANITPGSSLRPYIPATSAAVTTAAEVPYFTLTSAPALNSIEATVDIPASLGPTNATFVDIYKDATNYFQGYINSLGKLGCFFYVGGVAYEGQSAGSVTYSSTQRLSCSYDGTNIIACVAGTCTSTAKSFTMFSAATRLYVGSYHATTYELSPSPVIKGVKADPNPSRFR